MKEKLYDRPKYYDIAFSGNTVSEIKIFRKLFKKHVPFQVKSILEPACGSGRFLVRLPEYGYHITGYDNNSQMISYANKRIIELGLKAKARAVIGDMNSKQFKFKFDVAINAINSIGYLLQNDDIVSHFYHISHSIRKDGIYILHLSCAWDHLKPDEKAEWISEIDGIRIRTTWRVKNQDHLKKISHELCTMEVNDYGRHFYIEDHHELRLWFYEDLKALIIKSKKFKLEAIYSETLHHIPIDSHINGELGNLYFVLKNK